MIVLMRDAPLGRAGYRQSTPRLLCESTAFRDHQVNTIKVAVAPPDGADRRLVCGRSEEQERRSGRKARA